MFTQNMPVMWCNVRRPGDMTVATDRQQLTGLISSLHLSVQCRGFVNTPDRSSDHFRVAQTCLNKLLRLV